MKRLFLRAATWLSLVAAPLACNSRHVHSAPLALAPATPSIAPAPTSRPAPAEIDSREVLSYLASDELEGRGIGSHGLERAADYVAEQFQRVGLTTAPGMSGFAQPFEMTTATAIGDKTSLRIDDKSFKLRDEFAPLSLSGEGRFSGPVVFVGYGITSSANHYDDYANVDVKGKVALAMRFEPHDEKGKSRFDKEGWSDDAALNAKAKNAKEHGAVGLLLFTPAEFHGDGKLMPFSRQWLDPSVTIPVMHVRLSVADELLHRGGSPDAKTLQKQIDETVKPASRALETVEVSGEVEIEKTKTTVKNVIGFLPGANRDEFIVVGAHYDHLGRGGMGSMKPKSHEIHNGADDNASGTTAMIEAASLLARQPSPPQRSIVFVAFTGEEEGLVGSKWCVDHPPVPIERIVAMINLDMVGRVRSGPATVPAASPMAMATQPAAATQRGGPPATQSASGTLYVGGSGTAAGFDALLKIADERSPLELKDIGKGGFGPSDHMSFALKKIPVLFLFSGLHADYHTPTDDADKINYLGLNEVAKLTADVVDQIAALPRQVYVQASNGSSPHIGMSGGGSRVTFGVVPDYTSAETAGGVRISGTSPDSPAAKAGLIDGDVIVQFGGKTIDNLYDLSNVLAGKKPGDVVQVKFVRDKQPIEVKATLVERK